MQSTKSFFVMIVLFIVLAIIAAYSIAKNGAEERLKSTIQTQLLQVVNELDITLERHSYLPSLIANDQEISTFLQISSNSAYFQEKQEDINLSLELTNNISGTTNIILMNPEGIVLASSNWAENESFIDQDFSTRPYFKLASQNVLGRYFSVQANESEKYYYFASSVQYKNKVIGVIVAQVPLSDIVFDWTLSDIDFIVTGNDGNVFLSSNKSLSINKQNIDLKYEGFQLIEISDTSYQMLSKRMKLAEWDVRILSKYSIAKKEIFRNVSISGVLIFLLGSIAMLMFKTQREREEYRQQARIDLENQVRERTAALKKSQEDLIQAAKMAALGQLSTGITHEINNPLTAIRAYAENAEKFLEKDRLDMVDSNLKEITKLTENLEAITGQLKSFARKSKGQLTAVNIDNAINSALNIVHSKIISSKVDVQYNQNKNRKNEKVLADEIWLSQILVNLISNAISATNKNEKRNIWISVKNVNEEQQQYSIEIKDNGTGIEESNLKRIFEPFFTTKPTKKGLGLGLSISFNLAKDMNGSLDARNHDTGGALFTLRLSATAVT